MLNSINPKIWGNCYWKTLHIITYAYPDNPTSDDIKNMTAFFTDLSHVIPCEKCRKHYDDYLIKYPLSDNVMSSRGNLMKWLLDLHNNVNIMSSTKQLSQNDIENECFKGGNKYVVTTFLFVVLVCVLVVRYMWR